MNGLSGLDCQHGADALRGELALPARPGPHPGVVVFHGGLGLGDDVRGHARRLADSGYAAMIADMYATGGATLAPEDAGTRMLALQAEPDRLRGRAAASLQALASHPAVNNDRLAVIGFCFGGHCALELARAGGDLKAAVCFHGLLTTTLPADPGAIRGEVAVFTGARDPLVPAGDVEAWREEMTRAGASWQATVYGEGWHGFMDDSPHPRHDWIRYDPVLHRQAWAATLALLDTAFSPTLPPIGQIAHDARAPEAIH